MSKYKKASFVLLFILTFMLKLSKFPFKTLKTRPKVSDNKSTSILLQ
ncbi:MAG: hypothetical protein LBU14_05990 [Candidatus Peribacteria bacterium]|nr:hypothetical protein [Candidatus Peribacteria bacterium]